MRIAHFSDVHALSLEGARPWHFLGKRFAGFVNVRVNRREKHKLHLFESIVEAINRNPPDHVIVTGDMTNLSLPGELSLAREILDRLALGPSHVTVVPGNHDVYTVDALLSGSFWQAFGPYAESDTGELGRFPVVRVRGELAVIGVSTALPSPVPFADGWVGRRQLEAVEQALEAQRGKFRVVALHHPPYRNRVSILRGLRDRRALQDVLKRAGAELVLHGHEHRDVRRTLAGPSGDIPVIGVASGTYDDPRPDRRARYNVYTVEQGRLAHVQSHVHDSASNSFM